MLQLMSKQLLQQKWELYLSRTEQEDYYSEIPNWPLFRDLAFVQYNVRNTDVRLLATSPVDRDVLFELVAAVMNPVEPALASQGRPWGIPDAAAWMGSVDTEALRHFLCHLWLSPATEDSLENEIEALRSLARQFGLNFNRGFSVQQIANLMAMRFPDIFYFIPPARCLLYALSDLSYVDKLPKSYRIGRDIEHAGDALDFLYEQLIPNSLKQVHHIAKEHNISDDTCSKILISDFVVFLYQTRKEPPPQLLGKPYLHGFNLIVYGVPGSGKSFYVSQSIPDSAKVIRTVFHPGMNYADFVGQVKPQADSDDNEKITYPFVEGPFTRALMEAQKNEKLSCYLVIEEINRGDAPAIFGDMFQLLDRNPIYEVHNSEVAKKVYNDAEAGIRLPSNLYLIATMNTSDQGIFALDAAFQRRWLMYPIVNDFDDAKNMEQSQANILDTKVTWHQFCDVINNEIVKANADSPALEDKRLGVYFMKKEHFEEGGTVKKIGVAAWDELRANQRKLFAAKVLRYLWDDAFRMDRRALFRQDLKTFDDVMRVFIAETGISRFNIFVEEVRSALAKKAS